MEKILDMNSEFDPKLFDEIVSCALNPSSPNKAQAEDVLLRFKELPGAWVRIDTILKFSTSTQSHFIALQVLEETVKSKWVLFNEPMKSSLRQYVFTTVIERSSYTTDIVLSKFNSVLVEIIKKDWPQNWPTFIGDLIAISQSTTMAVSKNSLDILKNINEQVFSSEDGITTARKRVLRAALQQEYYSIFHFICLILEFSETQDLHETLLSSCLITFKSFCKSMPPEFVFTTKIVNHILNHLNSQHSLATIDCLMEIVEMKKNSFETQGTVRSAEVIQYEIEKINLIHNQLLKFFKMYLVKFDNNNEASKLSTAYRRCSDIEKMFLKKFALIFASIYSNWLNELPLEGLKEGLNYLIQLSKIEDDSVFMEVFPFWFKFIHQMYSEHTLRVQPSKSLKRNEFVFIFQALLIVLINKMPRPEEVFIKVNDLGEIIRDRKVETAEIDFYRKMSQALFNLSFCIEDYMTHHFTTKVDSFISSSFFDHILFNKLCWSIGSIAGALSESVERNFLMSVIKSLLSICEVKTRKEEKAIVASNVMFVIGQYHRFLKHHNEFLAVVIAKLFEFMAESYEGIKEMACDNFYKICERCPSQFFVKKDKIYLYEKVLNELPNAIQNLDYYLQRMIVEGMLYVLKHSHNKEPRYVESIFSFTTNKHVLSESFISSLHTVIHNPDQLKMTVHLIECYSLGFKLVPEIFHNINVLNSFLFFYRHISQPHLAFTSLVAKNLGIVKTSLANLFETIVSSGFIHANFLDSLTGYVFIDFKISFDPALIKLASAIVSAINDYDDPIHNQRIQFFIENIIVPAIPYVIKADEHIELSVCYLELIKALLEKCFLHSFPAIIASPSLDSIINSIFFSLTGIREISNIALDTMRLLFRSSYECKIFIFFNRFYLNCIENVLGLLFDRDSKQNYEGQITLLYDCIFYLNKIPNLSHLGSNVTAVRNFITDMFARNFKNVTDNSINLFIDGILEIKNINCFKDHIDDFTSKIYEFGDDSDLQAEYEVLRERMAFGIN